MLELTRTIDAPPAAVFKAWTDPEQAQRWWGPHGFTTPVCRIDLRPGGASHLCMRSPEGKDYWCGGVYREIIEGRRVVSSDYFSDAAGNVVSPTEYGMSADWPTETEIAVTFDEQDGKTLLTLRHSIPDELIEPSGAREGWSQSLDKLAALFAKPICPGMVEPQAEHRWLQRFVGEWTSEAEAVMEPGAPPTTFKGTESVRSLGGLWVIGEGQGDMPGGGTMRTVITFGFDPAKGKFVGTFVGSMMANLWLYEGSLDAAGKVLTLDTEGPDFAAEGRIAKFQDVVEFVADDHRVMRSRRLAEDGNWQEFMTAHYRRTA